MKTVVPWKMAKKIFFSSLRGFLSMDVNRVKGRERETADGGKREKDRDREDGGGEREGERER